MAAGVIPTAGVVCGAAAAVYAVNNVANPRPPNTHTWNTVLCPLQVLCVVLLPLASTYGTTLRTLPCC